MTDYTHRIRLGHAIDAGRVTFAPNVLREGDALDQFEAELARIVAEETAGLRAEVERLEAAIREHRDAPTGGVSSHRYALPPGFYAYDGPCGQCGKPRVVVDRVEGLRIYQCPDGCGAEVAS